MLAGRPDRSYQIENQKALTGGKIDWTGCLLSRKAISPKTQAAAKIKAKKHNRISDRRIITKLLALHNLGIRSRRDDFSLN
jgi:hypothetical protein